jgi:hypothetical protein
VSVADSLLTATYVKYENVDNREKLETAPTATTINARSFPKCTNKPKKAKNTLEEIHAELDRRPKTA